MFALTSAAAQGRVRASLRPVATLTRLLALRRSRRALAELDGARLDDIGLTRESAAAEARRPMWDVPRNWLR